ncbi:glycoside hydrolase family 30 [Pochonia chlamydosporia 170]|uniref:glucan endo-1,6-beta-glucosidase n=1 Tax=Pochonia chlamydosporia 170 TaxID=1380566 RepID=A0A179FLK8_METCM|nr:glycoside hydrolase family 30 [Pochonia chlamydosporia 170]OAQ66228.1 glycoside hydrolase family 30 [Pochonia chlamydosporia 170]
MRAALLSTILASTGASAATLDRRAGASSWTSTANGQYKLSQFDAPVLGGSNPGIQDWDFKIFEKSKQKQTVKGFGACVTDSTVTAFNRVPSSARAQLFRDLMTSDGINLNLMRHTIASSDLSGDPAYSYDDNNNQDDPNLNGFNLGDRGNAMASMLAEMRRLQGGMTLLGSPWSAPGWMKLNKKIMGTTDKNNLDPAHRQHYANYFVKYLQAYEKAGAHVDAVTLQNEPFNSRAQMPTMYVFPDESGQIIRDNLGPAIRNAGLNTKIWAWDHNTDVYSYPQTVFHTAPQFVNTAAWHCYAGNDPNGWTPLTKFHNEFPNSEQYMTECWTATGTTDWKHSSNFALMPLQNWANGIIAWALGTYTGGGPSISGSDACHQCTGLVTVDPNSGSYTKTIDYYMMGQFSKFMTKGGKVVDTSGSYLFNDNEGLEMVASVNPDGTRTVVIQNRYNHDIFVKVKAEAEGQPWGAKVPGTSVTTWVLPRA